MAYYTYFLRCADGSLYGGIASDLVRRMGEHFSKDPKCAKYTKSHRPQLLCAAWISVDRASASRLEYRIKHLDKEKKELLAADPNALSTVFDEDFAETYTSVPPTEILGIMESLSPQIP